MRIRLCTALIAVSVAAAAPPPARHYFSGSGALTAPSAEPASDIAGRFIREAAPSYGLSERDLDSLYVVKEYKTAHNGVTHLVYRQRYAGVEVAYSDFVVNVDAAGRVVNAGGNLFAAPAAAAPAAQESFSASVRAAMQWADPKGTGDYTPFEVQSNGKFRRFQRPGSGGDIRARVLWYPERGALQPAWEFYLNDAAGIPHAAIVHSASQDVLDTRPLAFFQSAPAPPRGLVFTSVSPQPNPRPGFVMTEPPPYVQRVLVSFAGDPQASPAGWVEGTETAGNNVIAGRNPLAEFFPFQPVTTKSAARDFQFPLELGPGAPSPTVFSDAAVTNLFYWMNRAHDLFWHTGFDEAAGNYQKRNFGKGGIEGDPILTYAQFGVQQPFGAGFNNAFYAPLDFEDGSPAAIAMFLGAGQNGVFTDGSYDAEVMIHEYTHGVTRRLVRNLTGHHGGAMSEAWSDFYALDFTIPEGAPPDGTYSTGDYLFQRLNVGIRARPYSTDMNINPVTFADFGRVSALPAIHMDAGIWVEALWDMRANLIRQFGETRGRQRARVLVLDGMKLSVPSPTLIDMRDAILLADRTGFNGASQSQIWEAFAKRGMGVTAFSRSNSATHVTASFARPSSSGTLAFSESNYVLGEPLRLILHDSSLRGENALVQVTSGEAGDLETVRLRRQGSSYTGTIPTSTFVPTARGDGVLSAIPGTIFSAYYSGQTLVNASARTTPAYTPSLDLPSFQFSNETNLNFRAAPGALLLFDLPFEFPFYGRRYSSVLVSSNGLLSFEEAAGAPCYDAGALGERVAIAPLWGDFRTNGSAQPNESVYVSRRTDDSITFRWAGETNVSPFPGIMPEAVNFAATLYRDGRIEFRYGSGNRALTFPSARATALSCGATSPVVGISNGSGPRPLFNEFSGRSNLENAFSIVFEPPSGASSTPQIRVETPNSTETPGDILTSRVMVWDDNSFVGEVYMLIDGIFRGRATPFGYNPPACQSERLRNCVGFTFSETLTGIGLAPGPHQLRVLAINARGGISFTDVTFQVGEAQSRLPVVEIEAPAEGAEVSGNVAFRGYAAANNIRIFGVDVLIDGVSYGRAQYGMPRQDVCARLGFTSPNCPNVGFTFAVNSVTGGLPLPNGPHTLVVRVEDETGRFTTFPESAISFRVNNELNRPPTGVLSTPRNGDKISGTVKIYGFAYDPDGRVVRADLLVDGIVRAALPYGEERTSECAVLQGVNACPNIGFWLDWNSKTVVNGPHVLGIRLIDDRGRAVIIPQNAANGTSVIVEN